MAVNYITDEFCRGITHSGELFATKRKKASKFESPFGARSIVFVSQIGGVFANPVTADLSVLLMQKIVSISMSNIAYARQLCPDDNFKEREIHGVKLKILRDDCEIGYQIVTWLKGAFDALHKQYLRMLIFAIHTGSLNTPALETYSYEFKYFNDDEEVQCVVRSSSLTSDETSRKYTAKRNIYSPEEIEKMTKELFESCQKLGQILNPLPEEKLLTMKLLYYDHVTPQDYEPPGFETAEDSTITYACERTPRKYRVGFVATAFHEAKVRFRSTLVNDGFGDTASKAEDENQQQGSTNDSLDVVSATPASHKLAHVTTTVASQDNHLATVQAATEHSSPQQNSDVNCQPDSYRFEVPKTRPKRATTCSICRLSLVNHNENHCCTVGVGGAYPPAKPRRKSSVKVAGQDGKKSGCALRKRVKKSAKRTVDRRNVNGSRVGRNKNKENVGNSAILVDTSDAAQAKDIAGTGKEGATTLSQMTEETHDSDKGKTWSLASSDVKRLTTASHPELLKKWEDKQASLLKSSFARASLNLMDVSSSSSTVLPKKDVNCSCNRYEEFGLMILCKYCATWQHSICYGIMNGNSDEVVEEHHCCVRCAATDVSRQCTDQMLLLHNEKIRMMVCIFRHALHLCGQCATITKSLMQREMELDNHQAGELLTQLTAKGILTALSRRSTTYSVNPDMYGVWLARLQRKS